MERLQPHESLETDVILLGHSMGGLLAAEVTLLSPSPTTSAGFKHRLIGTINFDSPFLGMHPGVITSGIGSIFSRAPESQEWPDSSSQAQGLEHMSSYENIPHTTLSQTPTPSKVEESVENLQAASANTRPVPSPVVSQANDPNFNPPFPNDVRIPIRNGWRNALHFINKHSDGLSRATQGYIMSHFEFGGCLADYKGLRKRYSTLRALEDNRKYRRRFVNYYTASTGKPKREKLDPGNDIGATITQISRAGSNQSSIRDQIERERDQSCDQRSLEPSRRTSIEEQNYGDEANLETAPSSFSAERGVPSTDSSAESSFSGSDPGVNRRDSYPIPDHEYNSTKTSEADQRHNHINSSDGKLNSANPVVSTTEDLELPPIPDHPIEPSFFDPTIYKDKDTRKLAGKEHTQQTKFYHRALKDRDTAIKNRRKFLEKRAKAAEKAQGKEKKEAAKAKAVAEKVANDEYEVDRAEKKSAKKEEKRKEKQPSKAPKPNTPNPSSTLSHPPETPKPPKDKKFCLLPSKTAGQRDPTWVRVYMPGVDEVGAHCGLFFPQGEHYEWLVRDVGERVATWIKEGR